MNEINESQKKTEARRDPPVQESRLAGAYVAKGDDRPARRPIQKSKREAIRSGEIFGAITR